MQTSGSWDSSEQRNRHRSPLLRLPGELRNKVYEYVLGGVIVSVFPSVDARFAYQLHAHRTSPSATLGEDPTMLEAMALLRVCRHIYAETRFLPLKLFTLHVNSGGSFFEFLKTLHPMERDAITTIQVSTPDANEGGTLLHCVNRLVGNDFNSQKIHLELLEWSLHLSLDQLGGLKRVIVEEQGQWIYQKGNEHFLRDGIASCVNGRNIDIVLPRSTR
ncbi:hypothetical protein ACEQ8H_000756 [Pleosporales sp. CAS-2024a]